MKKLFLVLLLIISVRITNAQGYRENNIALKTIKPTGQLGVGTGKLLQPIAGASITVCPGSSVPLPGIVCSPATVQIFADIAMTQQIPNPTTSDPTGNYFFVVAPSTNYVVSVSALGLISYSYVLTAPSITTTLPNTYVGDGSFIVDGVHLADLPSAMAALPAKGGNIVLPMGGTYQINTTNTGHNNTSIKCIGMGWRSNGSTKGPTVIQWTGGAAPMFGLTTINGFTMDGCTFDNAGTATEAIQLNTVHDFLGTNLSITGCTNAFSNSAINIPFNANASVRVTFRDSFFLGSAPRILDVDRTNIFNSDNTLWGQSTGPDVIRVGNTSQVINFQFLNGSDCESLASAGAGHTCLNIIRADGGVIQGSYFELSEGAGTTASQLAIRLGVGATSLSIIGNRFAGAGKVQYAIENNGPDGISMISNLFNNHTVAGVHQLTVGRGFNPGGNWNESGTPVVFDPPAECLSSSVSPIACGWAPAGFIVIKAGATSVTVNTTAVKANTFVKVHYDPASTNIQGISCNSNDPGYFRVTTYTPGTGFVLSQSVAPVVNDACYNYEVYNMPN